MIADGDLKPCNIAVIGEAPGAEEDESGTPFVGKSGKKLRYYLKEFGGIILGKDAVVLNVVSCRPPGNRVPTLGERRACSVWLKKNLEAISPKYVLLVGRTAAESFISTDSMIRGSMLSELLEPWNSMGFEVMHVYHPSYLDRRHDVATNLQWAEQIQYFAKMARQG